MATDPASSSSQSIGNPGMLVLSFTQTTGTGASLSVSFSPVYARCVQLEYGPLCRVNLTANGLLIPYEWSSNEELVLPTIWHDLPTDDKLSDARENYTQGYTTLLSFIRTTLSYYANSCTLVTPDGMIEHVHYWGGADSFVEAEGANVTQKKGRWAGTVTFLRCL